MPAEADLHDRNADVWLVTRLMLFEESEHTRPDCALMLSVIVRLKPFSWLRVIVEFVSDPALTVKIVGLAAIVKSTAWYATDTLWSRGPNVLVTSTLVLPVAV